MEPDAKLALAREAVKLSGHFDSMIKTAESGLAAAGHRIDVTTVTGPIDSFKTKFCEEIAGVYCDLFDIDTLRAYVEWMEGPVFGAMNEKAESLRVLSEAATERALKANKKADR